MGLLAITVTFTIKSNVRALSYSYYMYVPFYSTNITSVIYYFYLCRRTICRMNCRNILMGPLI